MEFVISMAAGGLMAALVAAFLIRVMKIDFRLNKRLIDIRRIGEVNISLDKKRKANQYLDDMVMAFQNNSIMIQKKELLMLIIFSVLVLPMLLFIVSGNVFIFAGTMIVGAYLLPILSAVLSRSAKKKFMIQLGDAITLMKGSLKVGVSLEEAVAAMAKELENPIRTEFTYIMGGLELGKRLDVLLGEVGIRMKSEEMAFFSTAVGINKQVGGNMVDIMESIENTIRQKLNLERLIKSHTAQSNMAAFVISALPVFLLAAMSALNWDYVRMLFLTKQGNTALMVGAALEAMGIYVIKKMLRAIEEI